MKIFEDLVSCEGYLGRRSTALTSPSSPGEELSSDEVSKINVTKSIGGGATSALPLVPDAETECDAACGRLSWEITRLRRPRCRGQYKRNSNL